MRHQKSVRLLFALMFMGFLSNCDPNEASSNAKFALKAFEAIGSLPIINTISFNNVISKDGSTFSTGVVIQNTGFNDGIGTFKIQVTVTNTLGQVVGYEVFTVPASQVIKGTASTGGASGIYSTPQFVSNMKLEDRKVYNFFAEIDADPSSVYYQGLKITNGTYAISTIVH